MRIWLDDVRPPPGDSWTWAKTSDEAIALLRYTEEPIEEISLDHDLGLYDTGIPVAEYVANMVDPPLLVFIHSMNPVGRKRMAAILKERLTR